jgi:hypothetical protein
MKAATAGNAVGDFRESGTLPLNMAEIPDSAYGGDRLPECEASSSNIAHNTMPPISNEHIGQTSTSNATDVECSTEPG